MNRTVLHLRAGGLCAEIVRVQTEAPPRCVLLGAGGHAAAVLAVARAAGLDVVAATDADPARAGKTLDGVPIVGADAVIERLMRQDRVTAALMGLGSTKNNRPRRRLFQLARSRGLQMPTLVADSAVVAEDAVLGEGTVVMPLALVHVAARVGDNGIVNSGAIVEHGTVVSDHVHVAPNATVLADCRIGEGAFIGAGAVIRQGLTVGDYAVVAAGAAVFKNVPPGVTVLGNPARVVPL